MKRWSTLTVVALFSSPSPAADRTLADVVRKDADGRLVVTPWAVPDEFKNPWPAEWEREFRDRADLILKAQAAMPPIKTVNTFFENEKRTYGFLMARVLAGESAHALKLLQQEDNQAKTWHAHTLGIDYFACFTLKHQVRKYFYFGDLLAPEYKKRMFDGAKLWTERDPLRRPHPAFKATGPGYGPDVVNSWVDARNTENLFLMRDTSVYLMAEETGNEDTRKVYKARLLTYAKSLYRVGMGEWDSENYHGHSVAPLLNLYDFAKDADVKMAAKLALDYLTTAGAVKYARGAFNGPTKRDYNHPQPFGGSAAAALWVYFGDSPRPNAHWESDEVHALTSSYRPPAAVVHLARKRFDKPAELFAAKATYSAPQKGDFKTPPENFETQYFGHTFQLGSLIGGTQEGDVNGFKALVADAARGAVAVQCVPGADPQFAGSPQYQKDKLAGPNRVGQNGPVAVWLVAKGDAPWVWVLPESIGVEEEKGVTFFRAEKTWFAVHPLNTTSFAVSAGQTKRLGEGAKGPSTKWAGHRAVAAVGKGGGYCGFAVEVGEEKTHGDFAAFKAAVLKTKPEADEIDKGMAAHTGTGGRRVKLAFGPTPDATKVWRNGKPHDPKELAAHLYREAGKGENGLVFAPWNGGTLRVNAGGARFVGTVGDDGKASFRNE